MTFAGSKDIFDNLAIVMNERREILLRDWLDDCLDAIDGYSEPEKT